MAAPVARLWTAAIALLQAEAEAEAEAEVETEVEGEAAVGTTPHEDYPQATRLAIPAVGCTQ